MRRLRRKLTIQRGSPTRPATREGGTRIERRVQEERNGKDDEPAHRAKNEKSAPAPIQSRLLEAQGHRRRAAALGTRLLLLIELLQGLLDDFPALGRVDDHAAGGPGDRRAASLDLAEAFFDRVFGLDATIEQHIGQRPGAQHGEHRHGDENCDRPEHDP